MLLAGIATALPTNGAATAISSNNFTVPVTGASGDTFIAWGYETGWHNWASANYTAVAGSASVLVYGAPLMGGRTVYYIACDATGCGATELTAVIPAVTPIPTTTFGYWYTSLSKSHFAIDQIAPNILPGYIATGVNVTVIWGIMFFFIFLGFWFRTRSVRMAFIVGLLMAAFIVTPTAGLYLGVPLGFQIIAQGLMAAALAGIIIAFIKK